MLKFRYDEKRSMGANIMGSGWNGRACWAVMSVARSVGGTEFSEVLSVDILCKTLVVLKTST